MVGEEYDKVGQKLKDLFKKVYNQEMSDEMTITRMDKTAELVDDKKYEDYKKTIDG